MCFPQQTHVLGFSGNPVGGPPNQSTFRWFFETPWSGPPGLGGAPLATRSLDDDPGGPRTARRSGHSRRSGAHRIDASDGRDPIGWAGDVAGPEQAIQYSRFIHGDLLHAACVMSCLTSLLHWCVFFLACFMSCLMPSKMLETWRIVLFVGHFKFASPRQPLSRRSA